MNRIGEIGGAADPAQFGCSAESLDKRSLAAGSEAPSLGWLRRFLPVAHLLSVGNDPVLIFRALGKLGPLTVAADISALPSLRDMDPQSCYLSWEANLSGEVPEDLIREVFEWVEDDSHRTPPPVGRP